jgi:hypothetical protein
MVDPGCSGGGFDDVQDLHEQRVVMARTLNAVKTIPQKGALRRVQRRRQAALKMTGADIKATLVRSKAGRQFAWLVLHLK